MPVDAPTLASAYECAYGPVPPTDLDVHACVRCVLSSAALYTKLPRGGATRRLCAAVWLPMPPLPLGGQSSGATLWIASVGTVRSRAEGVRVSCMPAAAVLRLVGASLMERGSCVKVASQRGIESEVVEDVSEVATGTLEVAGESALKPLASTEIVSASCMYAVVTFRPCSTMAARMRGRAM